MNTEQLTPEAIALLNTLAQQLKQTAEPEQKRRGVKKGSKRGAYCIPNVGDYVEARAGFQPLKGKCMKLLAVNEDGTCIIGYDGPKNKKQYPARIEQIKRKN